MEMLSQFVSVADFTKSANARRAGIRNDIAPEHLENAKRTCGWYDQICASLGFHPPLNSGYRSKALNALTPGASATSYHCHALALDLDMDEYRGEKAMSNYDFAVWLSKQTWLDYDKVIYEYGWVHIQFAKSGATPRRTVWTLKDGDYISGLHK